MTEESTHFPEVNCRHVAPSDNRFQARMRFHQSWYRHHVLGLPPGPNPSARNAYYGNILRQQDAIAGHNFLTPAIAAWAEDRLLADSSSINSTRLRGNLLSSQPLCFNLFAPLAQDLALATKLMRVLPGMPADLTVTAVAVEFAPDPADHLGDRTAFDAWIEYELPDSTLGFVGVETKLTESFSMERYDFSERYARWQSYPGWWWRPEAEIRFADKRINQLWRNHLLAYAMLRQPQTRYAEAYSAVLYHDEDNACVASIAACRPLLQADADHTLLTWPLSDVVSRWEDCVTAQTEQEWIRALNLRYLDLNASQTDWEGYLCTG